MGAERQLSVSEASRVLGMSRTTLLAAEEAGLLTPLRTPGGHRRYDPAELRRFAGRAGTSALEPAQDAPHEPAVAGGAASEEVAAGIRLAVRPFVQALDADTAGVYLRDGDLRFAGRIRRAALARRAAHGRTAAPAHRPCARLAAPRPVRPRGAPVPRTPRDRPRVRRRTPPRRRPPARRAVRRHPARAAARRAPRSSRRCGSCSPCSSRTSAASGDLEERLARIAALSVT